MQNDQADQNEGIRNSHTWIRAGLLVLRFSIYLLGIEPSAKVKCVCFEHDGAVWFPLTRDPRVTESAAAV